MMLISILKINNVKLVIFKNKNKTVKLPKNEDIIILLILIILFNSSAVESSKRKSNEKFKNKTKSTYIFKINHLLHYKKTT